MSSLAAELAPFVALGALGSLHCAGMCGGLAVAVASVGARSRRATLSREGAYVVGKACTYAVLGLMVSVGATRVVGDFAGDAGRVVAWVVGLALVGAGLSRLGVLPRARVLGAGASTSRLFAPVFALRRALSAVAKLPGAAGAFGAGAVNGLVPCGLSWAAIALAATASPAAAVLGPFLFGLATGPALVAVGGAAWLLRRPAWRRVAPAALGVTLIASGALTIWRAAPRDAGVPPCCEPGGPAGPDAGPPPTPRVTDAG